MSVNKNDKKKTKQKNPTQLRVPLKHVTPKEHRKCKILHASNVRQSLLYRKGQGDVDNASEAGLRS